MFRRFTSDLHLYKKRNRESRFVSALSRKAPFSRSRKREKCLAHAPHVSTRGKERNNCRHPLRRSSTNEAAISSSSAHSFSCGKSAARRKSASHVLLPQCRGVRALGLEKNDCDCVLGPLKVRRLVVRISPRLCGLNPSSLESLDTDIFKGSVREPRVQTQYHLKKKRAALGHSTRWQGDTRIPLRERRFRKPVRLRPSHADTTIFYAPFWDWTSCL